MFSNELLLAVLFRRRKRAQWDSYAFISEPLHWLSFFKYSNYQFHCEFRVTKDQFKQLYIQITKEKTVKQLSLLVFLYRIAHGSGYRQIASYFRLNMSVVYNHFKSIMGVLVSMGKYTIKFPDPEEYPYIAAVFNTKTSRTDIVAAADGTFVKVLRPSGVHQEHANHYYCRKGFFSVHMLALCDWRMKFTYVSVGLPGNTHDSTSFNLSSLCKKIADSEINLNYNQILYKILTDSAFRKRDYIVKTNATDYHRRRIMLSEYSDVSDESARTCIECIFGIIVNR